MTSNTSYWRGIEPDLRWGALAATWLLFLRTSISSAVWLFLVGIVAVSTILSLWTSIRLVYWTRRMHQASRDLLLTEAEGVVLEEYVRILKDEH